MLNVENASSSISALDTDHLDRAALASGAARSAAARLNGFEPEALEAAVGAIARDPSLAPVRFNARTSWQGRFRSRTDITEYELAGSRICRRHSLHGDEPAELLGENTAPNPQDMLLAALNACLLVGFVAAATARGIQLEALGVESSLEFDLRGAFGLDPALPAGARRIRYAIEVKGDASAEQLAEIHAEVIERSPNRYHLATPLAFDSQLIVR